MSNRAVSARGADDPFLKNLPVRSIGPAVMGGRLDDVAVDEDNPSTFYLGAANSGVWKTTNNGTTWTPIFDDQGVSSIGDIAIAPKHPEILWVGTGEPNNRQSTTYGDGVYKSVDGGQTWSHMGLRNTEHIGRILIDPADPSVVYVAAQGHLWGANKERGLFKTTDAGATWSNVLFVNEDTGVTDVAMASNDSQILTRPRTSAVGPHGDSTEAGHGAGFARRLTAARPGQRSQAACPPGTLVTSGSTCAARVRVPRTRS